MKVEFPGLGLEMILNRVAFRIGSFEVYWYGVLIGLGLALAMAWLFWKAKDFGVDADKFVDLMIVGALFGVLGARLYYVLFSTTPGEFQTIWEFFDLRRGGLGFYGALVFGLLAAYFMCKWKKVRFLPLADLVAVGFMIGQCVGRWGNFVNQEAFGTNTTLPWGMYSESTRIFFEQQQAALAARGIAVDPLAPVHPTFLYESLWLLLGFILLSVYLKRRKFDGEILLMYLAWNGAGRAVIEGLRTDSLYIGTVRVSQLIAILIMIGSIVWIVRERSKIKKAQNPAYLRPYAYTEAWTQEKIEIAAKRAAKKEQKAGVMPQLPSSEINAQPSFSRQATGARGNVFSVLKNKFTTNRAEKDDARLREASQQARNAAAEPAAIANAPADTAITTKPGGAETVAQVTADTGTIMQETLLQKVTNPQASMAFPIQNTEIGERVKTGHSRMHQKASNPEDSVADAIKASMQEADSQVSILEKTSNPVNEGAEEAAIADAVKGVPAAVLQRTEESDREEVLARIKQVTAEAKKSQASLDVLTNTTAISKVDIMIARLQVKEKEKATDKALAGEVDIAEVQPKKKTGERKAGDTSKAPGGEK